MENDKIIEELNKRMSTAEFKFGYSAGTTMPGHEDFNIITIADNFIFKNNNANISSEENEMKVNEVKALIDAEMPKIAEYSARKYQAYKSSSKNDLNIFYKGVSYMLTGRADDSEVANYYKDLTDKLLKILN